MGNGESHRAYVKVKNDFGCDLSQVTVKHKFTSLGVVHKNTWYDVGNGTSTNNNFTVYYRTGFGAWTDYDWWKVEFRTKSGKCYYSTPYWESSGFKQCYLKADDHCRTVTIQIKSYERDGIIIIPGRSSAASCNWVQEGEENAVLDIVKGITRNTATAGNNVFSVITPGAPGDGAKAQMLDLRKDKIETKIKSCKVSDCFVRMERITPSSRFRTDIKSAICADLFVGDTKYSLSAVGNYSDVEVALMWGKNKQGKDRSHFGLILKQSGGWKLNDIERKCLLFHHMGRGIEIAVGCVSCCRKHVRDAYGSSEVAHPNTKFYQFGRSSASLGRFLGEHSLGRNLKYEYNSAYAEGNQFYEWNTTNCLRLVFDLLLFLKLEYKLAVLFTVKTSGHQRWTEMVDEIQKKSDIFWGMLVMYYDMKETSDLSRVVELLDIQYGLEKALEKVRGDQGQ